MWYLAINMASAVANVTLNLLFELFTYLWASTFSLSFLAFPWTVNLYSSCHSFGLTFIHLIDREVRTPSQKPKFLPKVNVPLAEEPLNAWTSSISHLSVNPSISQWFLIDLTILGSLCVLAGNLYASMVLSGQITEIPPLYPGSIPI